MEEGRPGSDMIEEWVVLEAYCVQLLYLNGRDCCVDSHGGQAVVESVRLEVEQWERLARRVVAVYFPAVILGRMIPSRLCESA